MNPSAAEAADVAVASVVDDPLGRLALLREIYATPGGGRRRRLPYRRAASAFMGWQLRRGLLNASDDPAPGSAWWRAVNAALVRDSYEARELALGRSGPPSTRGAAATLEFVHRPTARRWYHAHNTTIATAYLAHEDLARSEDRVERFFLNLVLVRVLYAHALVAAPRLALGPLAPLSPILGDPRLGMTGMFLSLSRVLPDRYPLGDDVERHIEREHGFGHLLDVGVITPRIGLLYDWSATELGIPGLRERLDGAVPCYAWDPADADVWHPPARLWARCARQVLRPR